MSRREPFYPDAIRPTLYQDGLEFQDFVCTELAKSGIILQNMQSKKYQLDVGENLQGFEIKFDSLWHKTRRLSIEIAEKSKASNLEWIPSGIHRNDNSWLYVQGNYEGLFIFPKNRLLHYQLREKPQIEESHGTVRKFYLGCNMAMMLAAKFIAFSSEASVVMDGS